jgi:hypothetical protein
MMTELDRLVKIKIIQDDLMISLRYHASELPARAAIMIDV